ncbi:MAG TPA: hypothetical protein VF062_28850 [Candidatus Limnocylindrales bacterium]
MAIVFITLYRPVIEYMASWSGDIGRATLQLCRHIKRYQKLIAPRKTGALVRSIEIGGRGRWAGGLQTSVGANPEQFGVIGVAWWQDQGTRPHQILPRPGNARGLMVFYWPKAGRVVYRRRVFHPGNPATHWGMKGAALGMAAWR